MAPGLDTLKSGASGLLCKRDTERIVGLAQATICTAQHPVVCKQSCAVCIQSGAVRIHNPGKDRNSKLKVYHESSLLSSMGNVIDNMFAELLSE